MLFCVTVYVTFNDPWTTLRKLSNWHDKFDSCKQKAFQLGNCHTCEIKKSSINLCKIASIVSSWSFVFPFFPSIFQAAKTSSGNIAAVSFKHIEVGSLEVFSIFLRTVVEIITFWLRSVSFSSSFGSSSV